MIKIEETILTIHMKIEGLGGTGPSLPPVSTSCKREKERKKERIYGNKPQTVEVTHVILHSASIPKRL